ncbi:BEL1-like homeodomain protein 9 [Hevea brasiliensis]|uniref:BEL1-like homeodomain protein 9 n=1 Tax=Hevea brasiliensis TaxID=3981 RepID=UPI0025F76AD7|nr:BEL1-like homeodomain protein 9 [Hevea brasiliensis]
MAQNFEPFDVPQHNRRNKLRFITQTSQEPQNPPTLMNPSPTPSFSSLQNPKDHHMMSYHPLTSHQEGLSLSLSFQLDRQRCNAVSVFGDFLKQNGEIRSSVPLGPFTGYASILKGSRFLKPAQQILDDLCGTANYEVLNVSLELLNESEVMRESAALSDRVEHRWKNSKLMLMLDEVYRRYKLYCQQMQSVVASFESVAGLGNAAPYICYAIKTVSKHFTCLKNALLNQIHFTGKASDESNIISNERIPRFRASDEQGLQNQNPSLKISILQHPVWRSQRGLPDHAVAVLKTWLFEHFLHPYPNDSEKQILAQQTGLSRTQVSNWFINARVRLWKPMVEEVYKIASQQGHQVPLEAANHNANVPPLDFPLEKLSQTTHHQNAENIQTNCSRNELADMSMQRPELRNVSFDNSSSLFQTANDGVSLALGLHQNVGIDMSQPLLMNIAHHVNLEMISVMDSASAASFQAQNQHFGKD